MWSAISLAERPASSSLVATVLRNVWDFTQSNPIRSNTWRMARSALLGNRTPPSPLGNSSPCSFAGHGDGTDPRRPNAGVTARPQPTADQHQPTRQRVTVADPGATGSRGAPNGSIAADGDAEQQRPRQTGWWPASSVGRDAVHGDHVSSPRQPVGSNATDARGERAGGTPHPANAEPALPPAATSVPAPDAHARPPTHRPRPTHAADRLRTSSADNPTSRPGETEP